MSRKRFMTEGQKTVLAVETKHCPHCNAPVEITTGNRGRQYYKYNLDARLNKLNKAISKASVALRSLKVKEEV